jgi:hypothetical protein
MAWLDWLTGKKSPPSGLQQTHSEMLHSQQMDHMRSSGGGRAVGGAAQPAVAVSAQRLEQRRTERNAKRELLFQVVREAMVRVGVLSSAFKFKVLSLDQRGRSFLVMIELAAEFSGEVEKLAEIETMIAQTAKHRFEIVVQAVYWRYFNTAQASASAPAPLLGALHAPISRPAPLFGMDNTPSPAASSVREPASLPPTAHPRSDAFSVTSSIPIIGATAGQLSASRVSTPAPSPVASTQDDLGDDEVAAFRRALAAGATQGNMAAPVASSAIPVASAVQASFPSPSAKPVPEQTNLDKARSKLLLTGYEDTEMADDDPMPALSGTQYGELR